MPQVATVRTDATPGQVLGALGAALPGAPKVALAIIAAQGAVETANFSGGGMHNWNLGNITVAANSSADWMLQGSLALHFASYGSLLEGAQAMVGWLRARGALAAAYAGSVEAYVAALERGCYLGCLPPTGTATQTDYDSYAAGIRARLPALLVTTPTAPPFGSWWASLSADDKVIVSLTAAMAAGAAYRLARDQRWIPALSFGF